MQSNHDITVYILGIRLPLNPVKGITGFSLKTIAVITGKNTDALACCSDFISCRKLNHAPHQRRCVMKLLIKMMMKPSFSPLLKFMLL
jgi:hypothetical protein